MSPPPQGCVNVRWKGFYLVKPDPAFPIESNAPLVQPNLLLGGLARPLDQLPRVLILFVQPERIVPLRILRFVVHVDGCWRHRLILLVQETFQAGQLLKVVDEAV